MLRSPSSARCWWRWRRSMGAPPRRRHCPPAATSGALRATLCAMRGPRCEPHRTARMPGRCSARRTWQRPAPRVTRRSTRAPIVFSARRCGAIRATSPRSSVPGTLAGLRHDFSEQLRLGREASRVAPRLARPYAVIADAQIELGQYDDAARSIQRLVNIKPGLPAYARASYYRELTGDPAGAVRAMRLRRLRRRRPREPRVRADANRKSRAGPRAPARGQGCLPRLASGLARLLGRVGRTRARGRGARRPWCGRRAPAPPRPRPAASAGARLPRGAGAGRRTSPRRATPPHRRASSVRARSRRRRAARRRGGAARGEPRQPGPGGAARPPCLAREAEHSLRGRSRLGTHACGPPERGPRMVAARARGPARSIR